MHEALTEPLIKKETPISKPETPLSKPEVFTELKQGSKGPEVKKLQTLLKITADGIYGPITEKTVTAYQIKKGIKATGTVNLETWNRLNK